MKEVIDGLNPKDLQDSVYNKKLYQGVVLSRVGSSFGLLLIL